MTWGMPVAGEDTPDDPRILVVHETVGEQAIRVIAAYEVPEPRELGWNGNGVVVTRFGKLTGAQREFLEVSRPFQQSAALIQMRWLLQWKNQPPNNSS